MSSEESEEDLDEISIQLFQLNIYPGEQQRLTFLGILIWEITREKLSRASSKPYHMW